MPCSWGGNRCSSTGCVQNRVLLTPYLFATSCDVGSRERALVELIGERLRVRRLLVEVPLDVETGQVPRAVPARALLQYLFCLSEVSWFTSLRLM